MYRLWISNVRKRTYPLLITWKAMAVVVGVVGGSKRSPIFIAWAKANLVSASFPPLPYTLLFLLFLLRMFVSRLDFLVFAMRGSLPAFVAAGRGFPPIVRGAISPVVVLVPVGVLFPVVFSSEFVHSFALWPLRPFQSSSPLPFSFLRFKSALRGAKVVVAPHSQRTSRFTRRSSHWGG